MFKLKQEVRQMLHEIQSEAWEDMWAERFRCMPTSILEKMVRSVQLRTQDDEETKHRNSVRLAAVVANAEGAGFDDPAAEEHCDEKNFE